MLDQLLSATIEKGLQTSLFYAVAARSVVAEVGYEAAEAGRKREREAALYGVVGAGEKNATESARKRGEERTGEVVRLRYGRGAVAQKQQRRAGSSGPADDGKPQWLSPAVQHTHAGRGPRVLQRRGQRGGPAE